MAASITVSVGSVVGEKLFGNQAKAVATMDAFYKAMALGPETATNEEKLDAIAAHLAQYIVRKARETHVIEGGAALSAEADASYGVD